MMSLSVARKNDPVGIDALAELDAEFFRRTVSRFELTAQHQGTRLPNCCAAFRKSRRIVLRRPGQRRAAQAHAFVSTVFVGEECAGVAPPNADAEPEIRVGKEAEPVDGVHAIGWLRERRRRVRPRSCP